MKDHNKEIRNLTEAVNNLYSNNLNEQGGWPGGNPQHLWDGLWGALYFWQFRKRIQEILDGGGLPSMILGFFMKGCDMECLYQMWVDAGMPGNLEEWLESLTNPSDDDDVTPEDDGGTDTKPNPPSPSSPEHPLNRPTL